MQKCKCPKCGSITETAEEMDFITCYFCQISLEIQRESPEEYAEEIILDNEIIYTTKIVSTDNKHYGVFFIAGGVFALLGGFFAFSVAMGVVTPSVDTTGAEHYFSFNFEEITKEAAQRECAQAGTMALALFLGGSGLLYAGIKTIKSW